MKDQLEALVAPVGDAEVEAALRRVRRRAGHSRRVLVVVAGAAAVVATLVGAVALFGRDRVEDPESLATDGPPDGEEPGDGWPWTTATTAPVPAFDRAELDRVRAEVIDRTDDADARPYVGACCVVDDNRVLITVRADAVALAEEFHERWGAAVDIHVGLRRYPTGEPIFEGLECSPIEPVDPAIPGIAATLVLADETLPSGADTTAKLIVENRSDHTITVVHPKLGDVVETGSRDVAGVTRQSFVVEVRSTEIDPGDSRTIENIVIGTTNCGPTGPPGTPPGDYEAVVRVEARTPLDRSFLVRAPLTVTKWEPPAP